MYDFICNIKNIELTETKSLGGCWGLRGWGDVSQRVQTFSYKVNTSQGSKITADGDCSHEIKRCSLLGRKAMTNLDSLLKS